MEDGLLLHRQWPCVGNMITTAAATTVTNALIPTATIPTTTPTPATAPTTQDQGGEVQSRARPLPPGEAHLHCQGHQVLPLPGAGDQGSSFRLLPA